MSFENMEQSMREIEAIKYYEKVKNEKDEALKKNSELEKIVSNQRDDLKGLLDERKDLQEKLKNKEDESDSLRETLKLRDGEIKTTKIEMTKLEKRLNELEDLRVMSEGKTLSEAEKAFLKVMDEEIDKRANERFNSAKDEWLKTEKPKEVLKEVIKQLSYIVQTLSQQGSQFFVAPTVEAGIPQSVRQILEKEVTRRINFEFIKRVEEESAKEASAKLDQKIRVELPNWLKANVDPKAKELADKIEDKVFNLLKGPWNIACDKCNTRLSVEITPLGIEDLLRKGFVLIECANPDCTDFIGRHKIKHTLNNIISDHLSQ